MAKHYPKQIYLCARAPNKARILIEDIQKKYPSARIEPVPFDLSSLKSAKIAAKQILESTDRLDLLFLNAGISGVKPALTDEGYEWHFGVNHLAHAMFAQILAPLMLRTAQENGRGDVRIITVASEAAKMFSPSQGIILSEVKSDMSSYGGLTRYGHSKLANILFAKKLAQLYPSIISVAVHPGLVKSENQSKSNDAGWFGYLWKPLLVLTGLTVEEGVKTQLWAAVSPDARSGTFYLPIGKEDQNPIYGGNQELVDELWSWTEREISTHGGPGWPSTK